MLLWRVFLRFTPFHPFFIALFVLIFAFHEVSTLYCMAAKVEEVTIAVRRLSHSIHEIRTARFAVDGAPFGTS